MRIKWGTCNETGFMASQHRSHILGDEGSSDTVKTYRTQLTLRWKTKAMIICAATGCPLSVAALNLQVLMALVAC